MYIYSACVRGCVCMCLCLCIRVCVHACACACICVCACVSVGVYVICARLSVCAYVCSCACARSCDAGKPGTTACRSAFGEAIRLKASGPAAKASKGANIRCPSLRPFGPRTNASHPSDTLRSAAPRGTATPPAAPAALRHAPPRAGCDGRGLVCLGLARLQRSRSAPPPAVISTAHGARRPDGGREQHSPHSPHRARRRRHGSGSRALPHSAAGTWAMPGRASTRRRARVGTSRCSPNARRRTERPSGADFDGFGEGGPVPTPFLLAIRQGRRRTAVLWALGPCRVPFPEDAEGADVLAKRGLGFGPAAAARTQRRIDWRQRSALGSLSPAAAQRHTLAVSAAVRGKQTNTRRNGSATAGAASRHDTHRYVSTYQYTHTHTHTHLRVCMYA